MDFDLRPLFYALVFIGVAIGLAVAGVLKLVF